MTQPCILGLVMHKPAAGGERADYNSIISNLWAHSHAKNPTNVFSWVFQEMKLNTTKAMKRKKNKKTN